MRENSTLLYLDVDSLADKVSHFLLFAGNSPSKFSILIYHGFVLCRKYYLMLLCSFVQCLHFRDNNNFLSSAFIGKNVAGSTTSLEPSAIWSRLRIINPTTQSRQLLSSYSKFKLYLPFEESFNKHSFAQYSCQQHSASCLYYRFTVPITKYVLVKRFILI